ncbi:MAG: hypothetical protein ABL888_07235 [Pirellulaceae bacterium]
MKHSEFEKKTIERVKSNKWFEKVGQGKIQGCHMLKSWDEVKNNISTDEASFAREDSDGNFRVFIGKLLSEDDEVNFFKFYNNAFLRLETVVEKLCKTTIAKSNIPKPLSERVIFEFSISFMITGAFHEALSKFPKIPKTTKIPKHLYEIELELFLTGTSRRAGVE